MADLLICLGIVAAMYKEEYTIPICSLVLTYHTAMMFYSDQIGKIHRTISCALAVTEMTKGGVIVLLFFVEILFNLRPYNKNIYWIIFVWISISATFTVSGEPAAFYLALNAYYLATQFRLEARPFAGLRIDPIFQCAIQTFSEIIKFVSLSKVAVVAYHKNEFAEFLLCTGVNIISTNLDASTSMSLVAHAIAVNMVPFFVILQWWGVMALAHLVCPLYDFNVVAVYAVDALFFLRIWYF